METVAPKENATARAVRRRRSRLGGIGLVLRHRRPVRGASLVVALMVLAVGALLAAAPSMFNRVTARELDQTISSAPPSSRYLISRPAGRILFHPSRDPAHSGLDTFLDNNFGAWQDQLAALRAGLPEPLRTLVGPAGWTLTTEPVGVGPTPRSDPPSASTSVVTRVDIHADRVARLIAGHWPASTDAEQQVGIVLSEQSATVLGVTVGSDLGGYRIAGIFAPIDADADYWALNPGMVQPNIFDDGNAPIRITVTAFVDPLLWNVTSLRDPTIKVWYPLHLSDLSGRSAAQILGQLRGAVAAAHPVPTDLPDVPPAARRYTIQALTVSADAIPALDAALGRVTSAQAVLTVAVVGPLAAAIAVLMLSIHALQRRRRPLVGLLATRGASPPRLRLLLTLEGLVVGLLPAVLAAAAAWWFFGTNASPTGLVLAVLVGLLPAAVLAGMHIDASQRPTRADAGIRSPSRLRWVAEAAVLALAAVSLYLLLAAGLGGGAGTDLLVAAAPLLLAAAACVLVLRAYPLPLQLLARTFRRRRAAVGFLGSVRALRDPAVGVAPVLAVLAGVSVAVFSAVTLSTVAHGADGAALTQLGAPIRVTAETVTDAQYAAIQRLPGVAAAARTMLVGSMTVQVAGRSTRPTVEVYLADTGALAQVQRTVPGAVPIPGGMVAKPVAGAVVSTDLAEPGTALVVGTLPALVQGTAAQLPGVGRSTGFVLLDSSVSGFGPLRADAVLISPTPSADTATLAADLTALLGPTSTVRLAAADAQALRAGAMAGGMRAALIGALGAAGLAAAAALLLTMILSAAARARLLAILRILGLSVRQRRALVVWEQTPAAVVALLAGAGLGVGLAGLVRATVDLTPFTGGRAQPALTVNWGLLAGMLGGFVLLVAIATAIGLLATRRVTAAIAVKLDEE